MGGIVVLIAAAGLLITFLVRKWDPNQKLLAPPTQTPEEVSALLGMTWSGEGRDRIYRGEREGMTVTISEHVENDVFDVMVTVRSDVIPNRLRLSFQSFSGALNGEEDFAVGDRAFDSKVSVGGDLLSALAISKEARNYLALHPTVELSYSILSWSTRRSELPLAVLVDELIELARMLACSDEEMVERALPLIGGSRAHRAPELFADLRDRVSNKVFERAIELALAHSEPDVRVAGARWAKGETGELLREVAVDRRSSDHARARALELLAKNQRLPEPETLLQLLRDGGPRVMRVIAKVAPKELSDAVEERLINVVNNGFDAARIAAIEALADAGSDRALEALKNASSGMRIPGEVKDAAKSSIAAIRRRSSMRGGELAIVESTSGGALSMPATGGELAMAERKSRGGELSKPSDTESSTPDTKPQ